MMLFLRGCRICLCTMPSTVSRSMPSARAVWKALSRLGPCVPAVPARARVWQEPHFSTNSALPFSRSGSLRPHAARGSVTTTAHSTAARVFRVRLTGREHYPLEGLDAASITPSATLSQE